MAEVVNKEALKKLLEPYTDTPIFELVEEIGEMFNETCNTNGEVAFILHTLIQNHYRYAKKKGDKLCIDFYKELFEDIEAETL